MIYKLKLKNCHEVIDTVSVADVDSIFYGKPIDPDILTVVMKDGKRLYCDEVCPIDSLQEEPISTHDAVVEIPFGAKDSEFVEASYHIPDGYHAEIIGNEVVIKEGEAPKSKSF